LSFGQELNLFESSLKEMSVSQFIIEALGQIVFNLSPTPFDALCPVCKGNLRWVKFFGKGKRVECPDCCRQWVKRGRRGWQLDVPLNPS
jgi:hypothetical protein